MRGAHRGRRRRPQAADDDRGQPAQDEAGHDLVQAQPAELLPHQHGDGARDDARECARARHALPPQRQDDHRPEGGAKARPGVADHAQHLGFGVAGNRNRHQGHDQHHDAADPDQLQLAGVLAQEGAVDVLGQCAGAHQQLAGQRAHHGSQDGGQQGAGDPGVEELLGHLHEYRLGVGVHGGGAGLVQCKVGNADKAHSHGAHQAQNHPGHADTTGSGNALHRRGRHEAHQDMRLAEVAQAPGQQRDDADKAGAAHHVELLGSDDGVPVLARLQLALHGQPGHHGRQDQRGDHQGGLDGVGPADGQEAADQHIGDGAGRAHPQGGGVGHAEHVLEQARARHHARGAVQREEHQDHHGGDDAQQVALVLEAVGQVVGQGERIACALGVQAQPRRHQAPVEIGARHQADGDPRFGQARHIDRARQAHEQPAAHVRGAGRQRGDEAAQAAPAQDVVRQVLGAQVAQGADAQHRHQVDGEHDRRRVVPGKLHDVHYLMNSCPRLYGGR